MIAKKSSLSSLPELIFMCYFNVESPKETILDVTLEAYQNPFDEGLKERIRDAILADTFEPPRKSIVKKGSSHMVDCVDRALSLVTIMVYDIRSFTYRSHNPTVRILLEKEFHNKEQVTYTLKLLGRDDPFTKERFIIKDFGTYTNKH